MDEKLQKTKVIDGMLQELDMSKQDLIDLIKAITEQSISEDKEQGVDQSVDEVKKQFERDKNISIEQLAKNVADGKTDELAKYLSLEELQKVNLKAGYALSLKRAKDLGIVLDHEKISQMLSIPGISNVLMNGNVIAGGKQQKLSPEQQAKLSTDVNSLINNKQMSAAQFESQQVKAQLAQALNDPNSVSNPKSAASVVTRVMSNIRSQIQNITGGAVSPSATAGAQRQQQQQQIIQQQTRAIQQTFRQMRRHERNIKKIMPEVSKVRTRGSETFVTIATASGNKEINMRDYLKQTNRLTPQTEKLAGDTAATGGKLEQQMSGLSRGLPEAKSFQFDATGRLQVQAETEGKLQLVNIKDYISDLQREAQRMKQKVDNKKGEIEKLNQNQTTAQNERARALSRGPELDSMNADTARMVAERDAAMRALTAQTQHSGSEKGRNQRHKNLQASQRKMG